MTGKGMGTRGNMIQAEAYITSISRMLKPSNLIEGYL